MIGFVLAVTCLIVAAAAFALFVATGSVILLFLGIINLGLSFMNFEMGRRS